MNHWILFIIISLLWVSCSVDSQPQESVEAIEKQAEIATDQSVKAEEEYNIQKAKGLADLETYQDSIRDLSSKTVEDYYYLLPTKPYFIMEAGFDNVDSRKKGLTYKNLKNGYLIGGHDFGYPFTMALFKDKDANIDYIMAHRIQHPGVMYHPFFDILSLKDGNWTAAFPEISQAGLQYREDHLADFKEDEYVLPVLPEFGTRLKFIKCDLYEDPDCEKASVVFAYDWDGQQFVRQAKLD